MPKHVNEPTRTMMAEDMVAKLDEAMMLASTIASELDNGVNPPEMVNAWHYIAAQLVTINAQVKGLAR